MARFAGDPEGQGDVPAGERVCLGEIGSARGLKGEVFVRSFTADSAGLTAYGPLLAEPGGRRLRVRVIGEKKAALIVRVDGVLDRTAAEGLRGLRLYVDRAALPEPAEDEFYHADLIGLTAEFAGDEAMPAPGSGRVGAVHDFGAGAILEVERDDGPAVLVPFTREAVPVVDLHGRRIVVAAVPGLLAGDAPKNREAGAGEAQATPAADRAAATLEVPS